MVKNSKNGNRRSNASVFDISGIMLRMNLPQAEATMAKRGFKKVSQKFEIPNFIKWRFEEQCRNAGVVGYERLASCVVKAAKENNHQYVESEKFVKYDTQEEISISLTSNFTNNKIYKIVYKSMSARKIQGSSQKVQYPTEPGYIMIMFPKSMTSEAVSRKLPVRSVSSVPNWTRTSWQNCSVNKLPERILQAAG